VSEAIGRLISYILRLASPIEPVKRLREVVRQLQGIGGGRTLGFGPNRVRSLADGVSQVLEGYLEQREERMKDEPKESTQSSGSNGAIKRIPDAPAVSEQTGAAQDRRPVPRVRRGGGGE
jgi:ribonucleoside-diphosphate reductase alpha chain